MEPVRFGLVGVGGYGRSYDYSIRAVEEEGMGKLAAVVIRNRPKYAERVAELEAAGVPIRASLGEMIEEDGDNLDIVAIPTGINNHHVLLEETADGGFPMVLEKPPTSAIQYMDAMLAALERNNVWCQVGFQSQSNTGTVHGLKRLVCSGKLGAVREVAVRACWVRTDDYYERNPWAGLFKEDDVYVLDGTINNPLAHQVMNALYFACPTWGETARPLRVRAELYKGHRIESEDTSCMEIELDTGGRMYWAASLCGTRDVPSTVFIEVVGEKGKALWRIDGDAEITYNDGSTETIANSMPRPNVEVFRNAIRHFRGEEDQLYCPLQMTRNFVLAVNGAFLSSGTTRKIPDAQLRHTKDEEAGKVYTEIPDINGVVERCFRERKLYSDLGLPWTTPTEFFDLDGLAEFRMETPSLDPA